jgi:hypothetical protein
MAAEPLVIVLAEDDEGHGDFQAAMASFTHAIEREGPTGKMRLMFLHDR